MKFMKLGSKPDLFQSEGKDVRSVATDLPADIIIHVGNIKFHLHKFPLLSKSQLMQKLIATANDEKSDEVSISDIPGGAAAFEICAKFCYGITVTLNAHNVAVALCAAEHLEMHETVEKGNLIYKIDVFLRTSILRGWKDSIIVLQTTRFLLPWSEDLKLISNCVDSIASKASIDPSEVEWSYTYNRRKLPFENGHDPHLNGVRKEYSVPNDWWVEDLCELQIDFFKKVILAIKTKVKADAEVIGEALKSYTYRKLSSLGKGSANNGNGSDVAKNRSLLETIISLLPSSNGCVSCSFLLKLLRAGRLLDCSKTSMKELVKRIGRQLEDAAVPDLLIPSTSGEDTMYDIDMVLDIVEEFMMQENCATRPSPAATSRKIHELSSPALTPASAKVTVAKLVDGYLAEVVKDHNLSLSKFIDLVEIVPSDSRPTHDELYLAIDTFLKEHPALSKNEKKRLCALIDCKKLSADACLHSVQNERLPLRMVVQVLYFQQMRALAATSTQAESGASYGSSRSVVTTNTEDECADGLAVDDPKAIKLHVGGMANEHDWSSGSDNRNTNICAKSSNGKVKGIVMPKKMLGKLLSSNRRSSENSSLSDTSGSPNSNREEPKLTPYRTVRYEV
ncbi:phototropic-responsive NPH3 family protein NPY4-like [Curcuma longa]|uniref:phototropic-responsive NPH3 family protein NPY4-like n=1 Tax=Curcuma longa TaxID=136217 RepID=UPI003D9EF457